MMGCPSVSGRGLTCRHPLGHPLPHKGTNDTGRTVTWGFRSADRPMYPRTGSRPALRPFKDVPDPVDATQCESTYVENGLEFRCVKDNDHLGTLHRSGRIQWTS